MKVSFTSSGIGVIANIAEESLISRISLAIYPFDLVIAYTFFA